MFWKQPPELFCKIRSSSNFANFTGKHLCWSLFLIKLQPSSYNFSKKEALARVLFCEFREVFLQTLLEWTPSHNIFKDFVSIFIYSRQLLKNSRTILKRYFLQVFCFLFFVFRGGGGGGEEGRRREGEVSLTFLKNFVENFIS